MSGALMITPTVVRESRSVPETSPDSFAFFTWELLDSDPRRRSAAELHAYLHESRLDYFLSSQHCDKE